LVGTTKRNSSSLLLLVTISSRAIRVSVDGASSSGGLISSQEPLDNWSRRATTLVVEIYHNSHAFLENAGDAEVGDGGRTRKDEVFEDTARRITVNAIFGHRTIFNSEVVENIFKSGSVDVGTFTLNGFISVFSAVVTEPLECGVAFDTTRIFDVSSEDREYQGVCRWEHQKKRHH
jgi:hypothetical protein